jgi:hypothetical protein
MTGITTKASRWVMAEVSTQDIESCSPSTQLTKTTIAACRMRVKEEYAKEPNVYVNNTN